MKKSRLLGAVCACALVTISTTSNAAVLPLDGRLPVTPGGTDYQAYYDPNLGITWATTINDPDTWDNQTAWATALSINDISGWRLPSLSEMISLFQEGINVSTPEPFDLPFTPNTAYYYWSSTEFNATTAYDFEFNNGFQSTTPKDASNHAWAVHDGDVVPIPPALWLFGSGLLGLIGISRRKS